jgi:hypothetical protein
MQERVKKPKLPVKAHEKMRIAGKLVDGEERIEVRNPYTGTVVGDGGGGEPCAGGRGLPHRQRLQVQLTRYDRQKILTTLPRSWHNGARRSPT